MTFDKQYFDDIWGDVHRHDYCESLADQLISKHGKGRYLDIGTGCGYLVKVLRDRGCEAYGVDVSEYAVDNSHGNVLLGDVRNLPFKDNSFDVIFSQGLWEYIPEVDISKAYKECLRVGKIQDHNIDFGGLASEGFATIKPKEWWDKKLTHPKILIACPVHIVKDYAFQDWIDNIKSFTYPNFDILVIDNSPDDSMVEKYKDQIPIRTIDTKGIEELMVLRLNLSYEEIRKEFLSGDYERLYIVESDILPPKEMVKFMLSYRGDWISHAYPVRGETTDAEQGIGCSMFTRRIMETFNFADLGDNWSSDGGLWDRVRPDGRFQTTELWGYKKLRHLKEPD